MNLLKSRIGSILFWSVVSAAFIGPGTVTTAASSGASFGLDLIWALAFGTIACLVLQEGAARITLGSGLNLGQAIAAKFNEDKTAKLVKGLIIFAIVFGCTAYQAGNIMGAVAGIEVVTPIPAWVATVVVVLFASIGLWLGNLRSILNVMSVMVALMGITFAFLAFQSDYSFIQLSKGAFIPSFPLGSETLILGLVGTTIVPYNLFLASGISKNQSLSEMRFGISIAIILGGIISIAILVTGSMLEGDFSFEALAGKMDLLMAGNGSALLGIGLFCAGFTSSITAPMAAAITWQSVSGRKQDLRSTGFRIVWAGIMLVGLLFGISGLRPIPVILLAQALNGLLLPISAIFLIVIINDHKLMKSGFGNSGLQNAILILVVWLALLLGIHSLAKVASTLTGAFEANGAIYLISIALVALLILWVSLKGRVGVGKDTK